jgi:hypothetical protein
LLKKQPTEPGIDEQLLPAFTNPRAPRRDNAAERPLWVESRRSLLRRGSEPSRPIGASLQRLQRLPKPVDFGFAAILAEADAEQAARAVEAEPSNGFPGVEIAGPGEDVLLGEPLRRLARGEALDCEGEGRDSALGFRRAEQAEPGQAREAGEEAGAELALVRRVIYPP